MPGVSQTLTEDAGPLPVWAWAGIGTAVVAGVLIYKKKQSMNAQAAAATNQADSSNLGTTPVSNLTVAAEPMPIQMGDTFVNTSTPTNVTQTNNPVQTNNPPAGTLSTPTTGPTTPTPTTPSAQSQAERTSYDAALQAYQAANAGGASQSVLRKLMAKVIATQSVYQGTVGSAAAHTAYDQALATAKANPSLANMTTLWYAQAKYTGQVPTNIS